MAEQLPLDLPARPALGRGSFYVSEANRLALAAVDAWRTWPLGKLAIVGPEGAGKSHIVRVWAAESGALVVAADSALRPAAGQAVAVEDADRVAGNAAAEEALFHLHEAVLAERGRLLLTGRTMPAAWGIRLPDLKSRLVATTAVEIGLPDDGLLAAVLFKHLADRQLLVPKTLVEWLVRRMPRDFAFAARLVAELDAASLAGGVPVTRALAGQLLDKLRNGGA